MEPINIVTVLFHDRIASHQRGEVVEYPDGPFVRWLLKNDRIELIDPPTLDWYDVTEPIKKEETNATGKGRRKSHHQADPVGEPS